MYLRGKILSARLSDAKVAVKVNSLRLSGSSSRLLASAPPTPPTPPTPRLSFALKPSPNSPAEVPNVEGYGRVRGHFQLVPPGGETLSTLL